MSAYVSKGNTAKPGVSVNCTMTVLLFNIAVVVFYCCIA